MNSEASPGCPDCPAGVVRTRGSARSPRHRFTQAAWRYWCATMVLLALSLSGVAAAAVHAAIALGVVQLLHFFLRERAFGTFPVQIRTAYLALLLLGLWEPLGFIHWIQLAGTVAIVTVDYCLLARMLSLAPWNRSGPIDAAVLRFTFLTPPGRWRRAGAP